MTLDFSVLIPRLTMLTSHSKSVFDLITFFSVKANSRLSSQLNDYVDATPDVCHYLPYDIIEGNQKDLNTKQLPSTYHFHCSFGNL